MEQTNFISVLQNPHWKAFVDYAQNARQCVLVNKVFGIESHVCGEWLLRKWPKNCLSQECLQGDKSRASVQAQKDVERAAIKHKKSDILSERDKASALNTKEKDDSCCITGKGTSQLMQSNSHCIQAVEIVDQYSKSTEKQILAGMHRDDSNDQEAASCRRSRQDKNQGGCHHTSESAKKPGSAKKLSKEPMSTKPSTEICLDLKADKSSNTSSGVKNISKLQETGKLVTAEKQTERAAHNFHKNVVDTRDPSGSKASSSITDTLQEDSGRGEGSGRLDGIQDGGKSRHINSRASPTAQTDKVNNNPRETVDVRREKLKKTKPSNLELHDANDLSSTEKLKRKKYSLSVESSLPTVPDPARTGSPGCSSGMDADRSASKGKDVNVPKESLVAPILGVSVAEATSGWTRHWSKTWNAHYLFNSRTGEQRWESGCRLEKEKA